MMLLKELDWYGQSLAKLDYAQKNIEVLKSVTNYSIGHQIFINLMLNLMKSPMEYATQAVQKSNGLKGRNVNGYIPHKYPNQNYKKYKNVIKEKLGRDDEGLVKIYYNLQTKNNIYYDFNTMQNDEKHASINAHTKITSHNISNKVGNIIFKDCIIITEDNNTASGISLDGRELDVSELGITSSNEELYFDYNNKPVILFLEEIFEMVNLFVIEIKEYIEQKESPSSDVQNN